jgi:hypothetical protein
MNAPDLIVHNAKITTLDPARPLPSESVVSASRCDTDTPPEKTGSKKVALAGLWTQVRVISGLGRASGGLPGIRSPRRLQGRHRRGPGAGVQRLVQAGAIPTSSLLFQLQHDWASSETYEGGWRS